MVEPTNPKLYPDTGWETASAGGQCVETKVHGTEVWVRNSKGGPMAVFTHPEWHTFIDGMRTGAFSWG
jgi:hypothetical protein